MFLSQERLFRSFPCLSPQTWCKTQAERISQCWVSELPRKDLMGERTMYCFCLPACLCWPPTSQLFLLVPSTPHSCISSLLSQVLSLLFLLFLFPFLHFIPLRVLCGALNVDSLPSFSVLLCVSFQDHYQYRFSFVLLCHLLLLLFCSFL